MEDTIAAVASSPGGSARGIVRLSGPRVLDCLQRCFAPTADVDWPALRWPTVLHGELRLPPPLAPLPCDVYVWPTNRSYTRQPAAELHTLGSPPLLEAALEAVCSSGARLAEPGEFTLRAFLAGRLDLTQAEAVLGVIDAQSQHELDVALAQLAGGLAGPLAAIRNRLLDLLAHLEAGLDFVEEDIEFISTVDLIAQLHGAAAAVHQAAEQMAGRGETPGAWRVALVGWPNVGKSSLLNALADEAAAIVSEIPGTTRDYLRRRVTWDDFSVEIIDTAGVEPRAADAISSAAQTVTAEQLEHAHLALLCLDGSRRPNDWELEQLAEFARALASSSPPAERTAPPGLIVLTKADLPRVVELEAPHLAVSSVTGAGLDALRQQMQEVITEAYQESHVVAGTAIRCRESLRLAAACLDQARHAAERNLGHELVAAEVRTALDELGKVTGQIYTDDVLDRIFSRFCIGK